MAKRAVPLQDEGRAGGSYSTLEAIQVKCAVQGPNKLAGQRLAAFLAHSHLSAGRAAIPLARPISLGALAGFVNPGPRRLVLIPHARSRGGGLESMAAVGGLSTTVLPAPINGLLSMVGVGSWVGARIVAPGAVARRSVPVVRRHRCGKSRASECLGYGPPGREAVGCGHLDRLGAQYVAVVGEGPLQRSASAATCRGVVVAGTGVPIEEDWGRRRRAGRRATRPY